MKEPFDRAEERLSPPSIPWREAVWRELTWTPGRGAPEHMSLLRVLLNGVVVGAILAALILFLGLVIMALLWVGGLMF